VNDRALFVNLAIAKGQWDSLVAYTTNEWEQRERRTPEQLLRAGQLAQAVGGPHARELIVAATQRAPDDPNILGSAYFHATQAGWEQDPSVGDWLLRAAAKSGDQGPLKSISIKELYDLKPDWDRRQDEVYGLLNQGNITVSGAALALNQSLIHFCLLRPLANRAEADPRRRSLVYAFSGARPSYMSVGAKRVALDMTAIFTFAHLGLLETVISHHERVLIPDRALVWLFQERERASFHQPSRVKDAHFLKRLLADGALKVFVSQNQTNVSLAQEVGFDLAGMLEAAAQSQSPAYVIRSSPVHRVGSLMGEEADLTAHQSRLCSCQAVVEALRLKGMITASEEQRASSYLRLHEARWPKEPPIEDGAILYLDDLTTNYLQTVGILDKLRPAGFTAYVTKSSDDQDNQLIEFESFSEQQLSKIEGIRGCLAAGLASGQIEAMASGNRESEVEQLQAQLDFLATDKQVDAFVVDDRFVNRYLHMSRGDLQTPIITSLDLLGDLAVSGAISADEIREHRTNLRRFGYVFVPVTEDELAHHLSGAPLVNGAMVETAELRAIREAALKMRMSKLLQVPHEMTWLQQYTIALVRAARGVWRTKSDPKEAEAICEWLLGRLDVRGWACVAEKGAEVKFAVSAYAGVLHALASAPDMALSRESEAYLQWVDERLIRAIKETEPEVFEQVVVSATSMLNDAVETTVKQAPA
jgi:hypothetical protein